MELQNKNIIKTLQKIKKNIDFTKIAKPDNGYCVYGFANMFWLETVLKLLGFSSYRCAIYFLKSLKEKNELNIFYSNIGLDLKDNIPCLATFSQYKKGLLLDNNNYIQRFDKIIKNLQTSIQASYNGYAQISIDGKDIRHSSRIKPVKQSTHNNVKSLNIINGNNLIYTDFMINENSWIKNHFISVITDIKKK